MFLLHNVTSVELTIPDKSSHFAVRRASRRSCSRARKSEVSIGVPGLRSLRSLASVWYYAMHDLFHEL